MSSGTPNYVLNGLDSYSQFELNSFWETYDHQNPQAFSIGLSCSFRCNYKCRYCYAGTVKKPHPEELTVEEQLDLVTQAKKLGARTAVLCGDGDPLVDPNLTPIVNHCGKLGISVVVVTNAAILGNERLCKNIHGMSCDDLSHILNNSGASLMIKMDSIDPLKYNEIVGVPDGFDQFSRAVERLKTDGMFAPTFGSGTLITRVAFTSVVMKDTMVEVPLMRKFADNLGAQYICKLPTLIGCALDHLDFMYPAEQYDEIRSRFSNLTAKRETLMADTPRCIAWHYGPVVDIRGEVKECYTSSCKKGRIGNIREQPLSVLLRRRNTLYDITTRDFCPVKTRINNDLIRLGKAKLWEVCPVNGSEAGKSY